MCADPVPQSIAGHEPGYDIPDTSFIWHVYTHTDTRIGILDEDMPELEDLAAKL